MTNNKLYGPLLDLIEDRLELLDKTPATQQGVSQELQIDNHQAYIGKYLLMAQEYLTEEEQTDLFQVTCLTPAQRKEFIVYYQWFVRWAVDRELP
jgi:hypothetical protein